MKLFIITFFGLQLLQKLVIAADNSSTKFEDDWSESLPEPEEGSAVDPNTGIPTDDEDAFYSNGDEDLSDYSDDEYKDIVLEQPYDQDFGDYYDSPADPDALVKEWDGFDGFICGDGSRLSNNKVCNGIRDCFDCSDEVNCTDIDEKIFFCYDKDENTRRFTDEDPKCINMKYFCDGAQDCRTGVDELNSGSGFKCRIKNRFRTCVLPDSLVCDGVVHCEDESDVCTDDDANTMKTLKPNVENSTDNAVSSARFSTTPHGFFRCLSYNMLISQKQVCDGSFDCPDLSDECLCEIQKSDEVTTICGGMCTRQIWLNQPINENCKFCEERQIYWERQSVKKMCYSAAEVLDILQNGSQNPASLIAVDKKTESYDVIECFDQSLSGMIRARKCDGRPECLFGEDECGIDCKSGGNKEWSIGSGDWTSDSSDPEFCRLLSTDVTGFACLSSLNLDHTRKANKSQIDAIFTEQRISVCNGVVECDDGSDEAFCPKRFKCVTDLNNTIDYYIETYDDAQFCDGFSHCYNGADEDPEICFDSVDRTNTNMLPCGEDNMGKNKYFHENNLLDGKQNCPTGADECPPFLSRIPEIKKKFFEGIDANSRQYQPGISSHDRAVDNLPLQVFLIAAAFIGVSALSVSFVLAFYNLTVAWMRFSDSGVKDRSIWTHNSMICLGELVVNLNMTIAKGLICGYFAYIKIVRSEDSNYSTIDLRWRSSTACSIAGAIVLIGTQVPIFTLTFFGAAYLIFRACSLKSGQQSYKVSSRFENGYSNGNEDAISRRGNDLTTSGRVFVKLVTAFSCIVLTVLIWLPVLSLAGLLTFPSALNAQTRTYAWVRADSAPSLFRANLLDRDEAEKFASFVVTISNHQNLNNWNTSSYFTFSEFARIVDTTAPSLSIHSRGSYGYFGQSGACLPSFLVHVKGGDAPFDMAVSNSWTWGISLAIVVIDLVLIFATTAMTTRYAESACKFSCFSRHKNIRKKSKKILNDTFASFVVVEVLTWLYIISIFFLKAVVPDSFSDYTYTICCLVALGLNCGVITPFVLLRRKFRLKTSLLFVNGGKIRQQPDSDRIIEVKDDNIDQSEQEPLTNGKTESHENAQKEECHKLVDGTDNARPVLE